MTNKPPIKKFILSTFSLPGIVLLFTYIPVVRDIFFNLHSGPGWLLAMLCTPYVLIRMVIFVFKSKDEIRKYCLRVGVISLLIYLLALYPLAYFAERQMISSDWPVERGTLYGFMTVPFSLLKPSFWKSDKGEETSEHNKSLMPTRNNAG